MTITKATTLIFGLFLAAWFGLGINQASAQAIRTWVSGVGDDSNACSRTAPCQTWAGAYLKTAAGGEIDALDAGGFGSIIINKAITLDGGGGQVASILLSGNGIFVAAGVNDVVEIRNMSMNGVGGGIGIDFFSGKLLLVQNCNIMNFQNGIELDTSSASRMIVTNTFITNSAAGGVLLSPLGGTANVAFLHSETSGNTTFGLKADDSRGGAITVMIKDSTFVNNTTNGIETNGTAATVLVGSSTIAVNQTGVFAPSGAILSYGTNQNNANIGSNGTFAGVIPPE